MRGIDFFPFDGDGDHPALKHARDALGVTWAYVRAAFSNVEDNYGGAVVHVERASDILEQIESAGMTAGAYLMPDYRITGAPARDQVHAFADAAKLGPGRLPPIFDTEFGGGGIRSTGQSREQLATFIGELLDAADEVWPGVAKVQYISQRVADTVDADTLAGVADGQLARCEFIVARYPVAAHGDAATELAAGDNLPAPPVPKAAGDAGNWLAHQFAGDARGVLAGQTDLNRWNPSAATGVRATRLLARLKTALGAAATGDLDKDMTAYQTLVKLTADSVCGPATYARLAWVKAA